MAFEERSTGKFMSVLSEAGKFTERAQEGDPKAVTRINKENRTVHELHHDAFVGKLVDIKTRDSDKYGKSWVFDFADVPTKEVYHLQLSYSNGLAKAIIKMLPNLDLTKEFKMSLSRKDDKTSIFINQEGQSIKYAHTRENPNGLPDMVKIMVKGKETWDDTEQLAFLEKMVNDTIIPRLKNEKPLTEFAPKTSVNTFEDYGDTANSDDPGF